MRPADYLDRGRLLAGPDAICLATPEADLTYDEAVVATHRVATTLRRLGAAGPGANVAVLSPNHPNALVAILGIARAGATYVAVNTANSAEDNITVLRSTAVEVLFHHSKLRPQVDQMTEALTGLHTTICLDDEVAAQWTKPGPGSDGEPGDDPLPHEPDGLAYLLPTGGTTGPAKSVMLTNANLEALVANQITALPTAEQPVYLVAAPITHGAGIMALGFLAVGARIEMLPGVDPSTVLRTMEERRVTHLFLPPTAIYNLLATPGVEDHDYASLRSFVYAAAPMARDKLRRAIDVFGPVMAEVYGQSEHPFATILTPEEHVAVLDGPDEGRLASCGRSTAFTTLRVLAEDGRPAPVGVSGEIALKGQGVSPGYYENPEATAEVRHDGWHLTGDIGYQDAEGYVYIVDRKKDMIVTGGFNVFPTEVEQVIHGIDGVVDCAVVGVPDEKWGEAVKAVVELEHDTELSEAEVIGACKDRLGSVKAPKSVDFWPELPRSGPGKVLKREVRKHYWEDHDRRI